MKAGVPGKKGRLVYLYVRATVLREREEKMDSSRLKSGPGSAD